MELDRVAAMLLRERAPELVLRPGMLLAARVLQREGAHGVIRLAGVDLLAQLPDEVRAGERLRLEVREVAPERVVLRIADAPPSVAPGVALPLPDGRSARVAVEERTPDGGRPGGAPAAVSLVYESPELGRLDLRLELPAGAVSATVAAPAGDPLARVEAAAAELREALAAATGRPASVHVRARRDPFDTYA